LRGTGISLDDLTADGRMEMETGSLGRGVLTDVSLRGEVEAGEALVALEGRLGGGAVRGRGRVDLRALPGWSGRASAELASATYRGVEVDSASVNVVAEGGDMDLTAALALADSGSARLEGRWRRDRDVHVLRVDTLRFASLDVRGFLPDTQATALPPTQLNGLLNGEAKRVAGVWGGRGTLQLDSSTVGTETLRRGKVEGEVDSTGVRMTLDLALLHGELNGEARMDGGGPEAEVTIPEVRFAGLDVGGLLGRPALSTALAGRVQGEIRGTDPKSLTGRVRVALDSSTVAGLPVSSAGLELDADAGKVTASLDASAIGGTVSLRGESDLSGPELTYRARGAISRPAPPPGTGNGRDGPQGTLFARVGLDGSGTDPDSLEGRAWMVVDSASWDRVAVDHGQVEMTVSEGVLRLDSLSLDSQLGTLSGSGRLPLSSTAGAEGDLQINGMFERADMLAPLLGAEVVAVGEATFHLSAQGAMDDLELGGDARINALLVDEIRTEGIEASGKLHRKAGEGFDQGAGHLRIDRLRMPSLPVENLVVDAEMESGEDVAVTASAVLDDSREGRLSLRVQQIPDAPALRVEELEFRADEDQWVLQEPTRIALGSGVEIDSLLLKAGDQEIRARGRVARTGPLSLTVDVTGFRIGTLSDLAGYPALRGEFSGTFSLSGDGASPRMAASFRSALEGGDAPPSDVRFNAAYTGDSLGVDFRARMEGGVGIEAEGTFPVTFSLADSHRGLIDGEPVRLEASVDSLPLEWVGLFLPRRKIRDLHGILDGSVDVTGHPDQPVLEGALTVDGLDLLLPDLGVRYAGGRMDLRLGGDQVSVDSFRIGTEGGTLSGSGSVTISRMDHPKYDLNLVAEGFHAVGSSAVDVTSSGRLHISGTSLEPVVEGRLEILRADVYLGDLAGASEVEGIILTEEDYRELARVFGYRRASDTPSTGPSLFDSATLNLDVGLRRDSWIRKRSNPEMAVQFTGDLTVSKEPGDSIRLVGEVDPVPERSYVQQFGRRFSLAGGSLVFQGSPRTARVDLTAEYAVPSRDNPDQPEVTISLEVTGTPEELNLELSSNPPLEASDMVSYLAVGQPAGRSLGGGEGSLSQAGGALALGRLSSAVEAYAREEVGLDVVEITTDGLDGVTLLAGRYVSPDLYLGIRQPVSLQRTSGNQAQKPREPEFEVELQAVRWLLLNLQAGGRGETKVFVRSRISYD
jgi:translocation and assembly module TamB